MLCYVHVKRTCKPFFRCTAILKQTKTDKSLLGLMVANLCIHTLSRSEPCQVADLNLCSTEVTQPEKPQFTATPNKLHLLSRICSSEVCLKPILHHHSAACSQLFAGCYKQLELVSSCWGVRIHQAQGDHLHLKQRCNV